MQLQGMKTIYDSEVAYVNQKQGIAPQGLDPKAMMNFCAPDDANQIFSIAQQVVQGATLVGGTGEFTVTWNPGTYVLQPGPNVLYAQADTSGGMYMYRTPDGYRPIRIQSIGAALDQYVSELVASYDGTKNGLVMKGTPQGNKLIWA